MQGSFNPLQLWSQTWFGNSVISIFTFLAAFMLNFPHLHPLTEIHMINSELTQQQVRNMEFAELINPTVILVAAVHHPLSWSSHLLNLILSGIYMEGFDAFRSFTGNMENVTWKHVDMLKMGQATRVEFKKPQEVWLIKSHVGQMFLLRKSLSLWLVVFISEWHLVQSWRRHRLKVDGFKSALYGHFHC